MRKNLLLVMLLVGSLLIAACGDQRSDKEVVVDAFESVLEAESYKAASDVDFDFSLDINDPFVEPYLQMINDIELSFDQTYDANKELQEAVIYFEGQMAPLTINVEVPFLQDLANEKMYIETDSLVDNLGMLFPIPEEAKGKLIEIDIEEVDPQAQEFDQAELEERMQQMLTELLENKDDADFTRGEDDEYIVSFGENDVRTLIEEFFNEFSDLLTPEELDMINEDLDEGFDELFEVLTINQFDVAVEVDGDELTRQTFTIDFNIEDAGESMDMAFIVDTTYSNMNGDVEFTLDPENADIMDFDELDQMMTDMMMQGGF
ncbi:hypothetical protein [Alkalibacillus aidingensis]|uniref:hypothetical protein n=1 Tax=Alkalibacillus aidingensis TaxID=2747607 RepID=UPI001661569A|nr:hypothetical protein [Alkalibacillus aidingensis]